MTFSTYLANIVLDLYFENGTPFVSLHTGNPGSSGASEATGGSYIRKAGTFSSAIGKASANTNALTFTGMPACTITHVGAWDAESAGNFLLGGELTASKTLNAGDTFQINVGDCDAVLT